MSGRAFMAIKVTREVLLMVYLSLSFVGALAELNTGHSQWESSSRVTTPGAICYKVLTHRLMETEESYTQDIGTIPLCASVPRKRKPTSHSSQNDRTSFLHSLTM